MSSELEEVKLLLQALHVTQSNHTQRLTRIEDALGRVETDFHGKLDMIITMLGQFLPPADEVP